MKELWKELKGELSLFAFTGPGSMTFYIHPRQAMCSKIVRASLLTHYSTTIFQIDFLVIKFNSPENNRKSGCCEPENASCF